MSIAPRKVLFLQHASEFGGSVLSLLYTMQGLDPARYTPAVAFAKPNPKVMEVYEKAGIETLPWPGIETFEHTTLAWTNANPATWRHVVATGTGFRRTVDRTRALVERVKPDLVHLNSVVLAPSAFALKDGPTPLVWHVREPPAQGYLGVRRKLLGEALRTWPDAAIFLTNAERRAWVGENSGHVVNNFVNVDRFAPAESPVPARRELGLPVDAKVVLFVGGASIVKGAMPFIEALALVRRELPNVHALMPNSADKPATYLPTRIARRVLPLVGGGTTMQRFGRRIHELGLDENVERLDFRLDVERLLAASDLLVFPALREHFARPVVEAGAMGKPVVVSRLPVLDEMVEDGVNGLHAAAGDPRELADAMLRILRDSSFADRLGREGLRIAHERYDQKTGVRKIMGIYDDVFARRAARVSA